MRAPYHYPDRRPATTLAATSLSALFAAVALLGIGGCAKTLPGGGPDMGFLDEKKASSDVKAPEIKGSGPLFPLTPGRTWQFITIRSLPAGKSETFPTSITVRGPVSLPGIGKSGTLLESRRKDTLFRVEVLSPDSKGNVSLLALGESEKKLMTLSPAVPFLQPPYEEGKNLFWRGTARLAGKDYPATAFTRISSIEKLETTAGDYVAYRIDHILSITSNGSRVDYPAVYWLVPGIGPIRRRLADRGQVAIEDLKIAPPIVAR